MHELLPPLESGTILAGIFRDLLDSYRQVERPLAASQLVLAMLGMGATLRWRDFLAIRERLRAIALVVVAQFLLCPLAAALLDYTLALPAGVALGILLLSAMPSGSLSNVFTHLGQGNLPLSITATIASTLTCLLCTPLVLDLLAGAALPEGFRMPTWRIIRDVSLYLLIPVSVGIYLHRRFPAAAPAFARWTVRASLVVLAVIVVGSLTSGRIDVWDYGLLVPVLLVVFVVLQFVLAAAVALAIRYPLVDAYTVGIEVALRNGNLAILLSSTLFAATAPGEAELSAGALYVALFYGGASLVVALLLVAAQRLAALWLDRRPGLRRALVPDADPSRPRDAQRCPDDADSSGCDP